MEKLETFYIASGNIHCQWEWYSYFGKGSKGETVTI